MSGYTSEFLHHFTGGSNPENDEENYKALVKIINEGLISYGPNFPRKQDSSPSITIDTNNSLLSKDIKRNFLYPNIVCFCEIPIQSISIHAKKYGRFGISFSKKYLIKNGARPVMYLPYSQEFDCETTVKSNEIDKKLNMIFNHMKENKIQPTHPDGKAMDMLLWQFASYLKAFDYNLEMADKDNYYMENEWRTLNPVEFTKDEIEKIFVATEKYRDQLILEVSGIEYSKIHII